jgi:hypothetical protein
MKKALGICGLLALTVLPADGGQALSVKVTPLKSFAPAMLRVLVRIGPNANNRSLALIADGENFYRSSEVPLAGNAAPKLIEFSWPSLPEGEYSILAVLSDAAGRERAVAHESVSVIPIDGQ